MSIFDGFDDIRKPIIGLSIAKDTIEAAIQYLGAQVVVVPKFVTTKAEADDVVSKLDGIIFPGGGDFHSSRFNEPMLGTENADLARDEHEFSLFAAAYKKGISMLGICRGCQVINVALGGSLVQDIPSQWQNPIPHRNPDFRYHKVYVEKDSELFKIVGGIESKPYYSSHHQCIKKVGDGLRIVAKAFDGVPEAFEGDNIMGLQFHPETEWLDNIAIFRHFVNMVIANVR